jgi:hypothetical protein
MGNTRRFFAGHFLTEMTRFFMLRSMPKTSLLKTTGLAAFLLLPISASAATYYLDADGGSDANTGTSEGSAWQTLDHASSQSFQPGDSILLQRGDSFTGKLLLDGQSGSSGSPIIIGAYGTGDKPAIDASGYIAGVHIRNASYIEVSDLEITGDGGTMVDGSPEGERFGVLMDTTTGGVITHLTIQDLFIHDIYPAVGTPSEGANPTTHMGFGVVARGQSDTTSEHIVVQRCTIERVGFKAINFSRVNFIDILNNTMLDIGGPAIQPGRCNDIVVRGNSVTRSGSYADPRMHGRGSGIWPWTCERVLIEKNTFTGARGRGDSCGIHIDYNCNHVVVQYNLSVDNSGGFIEILGNSYNNAYRYNISINDGRRVKGVTDQGSLPNDQDGHIIFISGYTGSNPNTGPFNSYLYNNTIYVSSDIHTAFHIQENARGLLIANNIFYIEGTTFDGTSSSLDDYTQDMIDSVVWENNLYQRTGIIPASFPFAETNQTIGDPLFANPGGLTAADYIPASSSLVEDQGVVIEKIPGDTLGLEAGLMVAEDYFGNPVVGAPDLGAIEIGGTQLPLPAAAFDQGPTAQGVSSVTMTSVQGPFNTEYYFTETSGNFGGSNSGWQLDPTFIDDDLLPNTTYSYTVTLRNASDVEEAASAAAAVTTSSNLPTANLTLFSEDFSTNPDPSNQSSPYPVNTWHVAYQTEDESSSVASPNGQLRLGWGYDAVTVVYITDLTFDLGASYQFSGNWEIENVLDVHQGIVLGIGEFNPSTGALISRVKETTAGDLSAPAIGQSGDFLLQVSASELDTAGVSAGSLIGIFFEHVGAFTPGRNDVYLVDDLLLETTNSVLDTDGDRIPDGDELDLGLNPDNPADGALDGDGDGFTNEQEYRMGTDLFDATSRLTVNGEVSGGMLELQLSQSLVHPGRVYIFEHSADLIHWTASDALSGADVTSDLVFTLPITGPKGFARVRIEWE